MQIFGRKTLDRDRKPIPLDFDELIFEISDSVEIVISLYRARTDGRVEVRTNGRIIAVMPRAANLIEIETR